jgi:hypothetical protein
MMNNQFDQCLLNSLFEHDLNSVIIQDGENLFNLAGVFGRMLLLLLRFFEGISETIKTL